MGEARFVDLECGRLFFFNDRKGPEGLLLKTAVSPVLKKSPTTWLCPTGERIW